jgi:hypothetical protein
MKIAALLVASIVAVALATTAAARSKSAEAFAVATSWQNINGQYGRVWPKLHPRYQRVTTREKWEACQRKRDRETVEWEWLSLRATDSYPDARRLPLLGYVRFTAVSMVGRIRHPVYGTRTIRDTLNYMRIGGRWKGLWEPTTYRAYRAGRCPN